MAELRPGDRLVLNCYGEDKTLLDPAAVERAQQFVDELAATLPVALRIAQQASDVHHLQQALVNRSVIDQALGVLMAQNRCSRDEAFGILRRASQNRNVKLRDVAAAIVERLTGHPVAPPAGFNRSQD
nr:ANTAR domain-containing protein [Auraticoccus cholistanensis]